jgi:hypothetical protein
MIEDELLSATVPCDRRYSSYEAMKLKEDSISEGVGGRE